MLGERPKAEENFGRALPLAPQDSEIRQNWGWYLCTNGRARESIPEFEAALRNPLYKTPEVALINAGKCSAAFGEVTQAEAYFRRALQASPGNAIAAYNLALLAYKAARFDEARNSMRIVMQETNPPPEALFLGMCIERKGDRRPNCRTSRSCATAIPTRRRPRRSPPGAASETGARSESPQGLPPVDRGRPTPWHRDPAPWSGGRRVRPARAAKARRACRRSTEVGRHPGTAIRHRGTEADE